VAAVAAGPADARRDDVAAVRLQLLEVASARVDAEYLAARVEEALMMSDAMPWDGAVRRQRGRVAELRQHAKHQMAELTTQRDAWRLEVPALRVRLEVVTAARDELATLHGQLTQTMAVADATGEEMVRQVEDASELRNELLTRLHHAEHAREMARAIDANGFPRSAMQRQERRRAADLRREAEESMSGFATSAAAQREHVAALRSRLEGAATGLSAVMREAWREEAAP